MSQVKSYKKKMLQKNLSFVYKWNGMTTPLQKLLRAE